MQGNIEEVGVGGGEPETDLLHELTNARYPHLRAMNFEGEGELHGKQSGKQRREDGGAGEGALEERQEVDELIGVFNPLRSEDAE